LKEQRTFFEVSRHQGDAMIRPRAAAERLPPCPAEAALDWMSNQTAALEEWLRLQADKNLDDTQLKGRLRLLGFWFVARGGDAPAKSIFAVCGASRDKPLHTVAAEIFSPMLDTQAESTSRQRQTLKGDTKKHAVADPARSVALRGIPPQWTKIDCVDFILNLLGEADLMVECHLFPWRKGKGQRKAIAVFEKPASAEKMLIHPKVCLSDFTVHVERLIS